MLFEVKETACWLPVDTDVWDTNPEQNLSNCRENLGFVRQACETLAAAVGRKVCFKKQIPLCGIKRSFNKKQTNNPIVFALLSAQDKMHVGMNLSLADRSCNC